jgi:hypothetical protein
MTNSSRSEVVYVSFLSPLHTSVVQCAETERKGTFNGRIRTQPLLRLYHSAPRKSVFIERACLDVSTHL